MSSVFKEGILLAESAYVNGVLQTEKFLEICHLAVSVVEQLGTSFHIVKTDINGNCQRLQNKHTASPAQFAALFAIVEDEVDRKANGPGDSCTRGLLWLKRAMEFTMRVLQLLLANKSDTLYTIVHAAYNDTLCRYHGWIVSGVFTVAFNFVPSRESFFQQLNHGTSQDIPEGMEDFVRRFSAILKDVHEFLAQRGLDDPTKV